MSSRGAGSTGSSRRSTAAGARAKAETIHERSARLQREQGLRSELNPETLPPGPMGIGKTVPVFENGAHLLPADRVREINLAAPIDPNFLMRLYGEHGLGAELSNFTGRQRLNEAAEIAGVKPGRTNAETISRITSHVTQGRYSANFAKQAPSRAEVAAKKSAQFESKIAKLEQQLASTRAAYEAHKAATGQQGQGKTATPARTGGGTTRTRSARELPPGVPELVNTETRLRNNPVTGGDPTNPHLAWQAFGGTRQSLYDVLKGEPGGVLEAMARRAASGGAKPPRGIHTGRYADAISRHRFASFIADQMAREHGQG